MSKVAHNLLKVILCLSLLCSCNPVTVHKITTTIFDGVPSLPPTEQLCQEYHEAKVTEEAAKANAPASALAAQAKKAAIKGHPPYMEKRCNDCHDKSTDSGLIKPKDQICFVCHPTIIKKYYVHGPVSVGACLDCHDPHSSGQPALLKVEKKDLCAVCHKEKRIAESMHKKVTESGMACTDCHDPHDGDAKYFLR
ncbi:cytochrome c3 family protein [Geomonas anaerohicana]|uniref:Cytochrome C n=1 Tax=Geomonas anaerohicana TaxID=2798583 RepID=A0ABS0YH15_9BACT|nr:cytochrome c3 family protein [Geomonas anaerohicana]MBJ6751595.1 cytochrome C [Geomonas anaerohicana]